MTCPNCRAEVDARKRFCGNCGAMIAAISGPALSGSSQNQNCGGCGSLLSQGKQFCAACGRRVQEDIDVLTEKPPSVTQTTNPSAFKALGTAAKAAKYRDQQATTVAAVQVESARITTKVFSKRGLTFTGIFCALLLGVSGYMFFSGMSKTTSVTPPAGSMKSQPAGGVTLHGVSKDADFERFYSQFRVTVRSRDQVGLHNLMAPRFQWALDGTTSRDQAFNNLAHMGWPAFWQSASVAVSTSARPCKPATCNDHSGYVVFTKNPVPFGMLFEKGSDNQWYWSALLGD